MADEGYLNTTKDTLELRFQVRASTFFQKCRDQQWYINQLLRQQSQHLSQIREVKDRLEREQMKNLALASSSEKERLNKLKIIKETQQDDLLVIQQQQAIFNDATSFSNLTHDLRQLSSDASKNRNRSSGNRSDNHESRKELSVKLSGKPKQSSSTSGSFSTHNETRTTTTTSLAFSFSSPNLATNTSFSSSSDSSEFDVACGISTIVKVQNHLDDTCSIDENEQLDHESLNLAGENDVEYAELTQRMIPPSQKTQQKLESVTSQESDLNLLNLFDASSGSPRNIDAESSSCNSSLSGSSNTSLRPASSVLPINNLFESSGATNELTSLNAYANNFDLPSDLNQETAHSLPPEISCSSPVWKPV